MLPAYSCPQPHCATGRARLGSQQLGELRLGIDCADPAGVPARRFSTTWAAGLAGVHKTNRPGMVCRCPIPTRPGTLADMDGRLRIRRPPTAHSSDVVSRGRSHLPGAIRSGYGPNAAGACTYLGSCRQSGQATPAVCKRWSVERESRVSGTPESSWTTVCWSSKST